MNRGTSHEPSKQYIDKTRAQHVYVVMSRNGGFDQFATQGGKGAIPSQRHAAVEVW